MEAKRAAVEWIRTPEMGAAVNQNVHQIKGTDFVEDSKLLN